MAVRISLTICLFSLLISCSGSGGTTLEKGDVDALPADVSGDAGVGVPDEISGTPDLGKPSPEVVEDLSVFEESSCLPGAGCFLEPCSSGDDCDSGYCVLHQGEKVCTQTCVEECPQGFECSQLAGADPDIVFVCASLFPPLCLPCDESGDCEEFAGLGSACVSYGDEGHFCGAACSGDGDCPAGYQCGQVATVDGLLTAQCLREEGACDCTAYAVQSSLTTTCIVENEWGVCYGERACQDDQLTPCDAASPGQEVCDGVDNNCDGEVDEAPPGMAGICDDANPCTTDSCNGESGCANDPATGGECLDGDACTIGDHCEAGECVGSAISCDDDNPCTSEMCDTELGCLSEYVSSPCDDLNPCTFSDTCLAGECVGLPGLCECSSDDDCAGITEGNLCLGTWYCDKSASPYQCVQVPGSAVKCPAAEGVDKQCYENVCDPATGECASAPHNQGQPCDDGDLCTAGEQCVDGVCVGGVSVNCADDNLCTDDLCEPAFGCIHIPNAGACSDDDACTSGDACAGGDCVAGGAVICDDENPCTVESCDPGSGCTYATAQGDCDDGNACTSGDHCLGGWCVPDEVVGCDDQNPCTDDSCDPTAGCVNSANDAWCSDGSACTAGDQCVAGSCIAGEPLDCDDENVCTDDACDQILGCVHVANQADCDDGNECTQGDQCANGWCTPSGLAQCDDNNACTDDSCHPVDGCVFQLNTKPCDDGDVCTLNDACSLGSCKPGVSLFCNDFNPCTEDSCDPGVGCEFTPFPGECTDGNECTAGDHCSGGICLTDGILDCDDDNPCTFDWCDAVLGCLHEAAEGECSDGDPCTTGDACLDGQCKPGPQLDCDDNNECTVDLCDEVELCVHQPLEAGCDDGNLCTVTDACVDGECVGTDPLVCSDGDACTSDLCDPSQGCIFTPISPCCGNGVEEGGEDCDDGNLVNGDGCSGLCQFEGGTCSNGSQTDCNVPGSTLIPSSAFVDPNPPDGWTQCGGFVNTGGDDVSNSFMDGCLNTNRLRVKAWNVGSGQLEEDVYDDQISLGGSWPNWNYLGGSMTKIKFTYWTGNTTFFTTANGQDACNSGCCNAAPGGTITLGTGNGDSAIIAPGNTNGLEWRVSCGGQALPGRKIAIYR